MVCGEERKHQMKKIALALALLAAPLAGCVVPSSNSPTYSGSVGASAPSLPAFTTSAAPTGCPPSAGPVTISGQGEMLQTANLAACAYVVNYQASSFTMIVSPIMADGTEGMSIINAFADDTDSGAVGQTTYKAQGRTTFQVSNTRGPWTLTFTPLA